MGKTFVAALISLMGGPGLLFFRVAFATSKYEIAEGISK